MDQVLASTEKVRIRIKRNVCVTRVKFAFWICKKPLDCQCVHLTILCSSLQWHFVCSMCLLLLAWHLSLVANWQRRRRSSPALQTNKSLTRNMVKLYLYGWLFVLRYWFYNCKHKWKSEKKCYKKNVHKK